MSIQLISSNHAAILNDILKNAQSSIRIISPFIGQPIVNRLCAMLKNKPDTNCEIITRFCAEDFINGASSILAIQELINANIAVYALCGLHTKLYLINDDTALLGSANFTSGGFRLNHELSLYIRDEAEVLDDMHGYYNDLLAKIKDQGDYRITQGQVDKEIHRMEQARRQRKKEIISHNIYQFGAVLRKEDDKITGGTPDPIQTILTNSDIATVPEGIWLKFEGDAQNRDTAQDHYEIVHSSSYPNGITCFPMGNKPSGMKAGDYIYLAEIATDYKGNHTPVIVGRARTCGFKKYNIADEQMIAQFPWMTEYPAYVELYEAEFLNTTIGNGISLLDVLSDVRDDTYPTTVGTGKRPEDLRSMHYQKSHMRITNIAKSYLDERFQKKVKEFGSIKL